VDLRRLSYFVAVAEEKGFRAASRRLLIAQPGLSAALGQLERELGVELLVRSARGVELTEAGREFLGYATAILRQSEEAKAAMRACAQRLPGLRVGAIAGVLAASELTGPIVREVRDRWPDLHLEVEELSFCDQFSPLLCGHFDVALVRDPIEHGEIEWVPIARERRALLVGAEHPLADAGELDAEDVLDQPMLPLGSPDEWSRLWQLDELRGGPNLHPEAPAANSIQFSWPASPATRVG
jgi:DNA-binding transcriptional LysR family regulator